ECRPCAAAEFRSVLSEGRAFRGSSDVSSGREELERPPFLRLRRVAGWLNDWEAPAFSPFIAPTSRPASRFLFSLLPLDAKSSFDEPHPGENGCPSSPGGSLTSPLIPCPSLIAAYFTLSLRSSNRSSPG